MKKYPRTFHLSFSPEVHSDDKVCDMTDVQKLIDDEIEIVITEKLDGGNVCLSPEGVFARSHAQETSCPTFDYIKNVHYYPNKVDIVSDNLKVFGENMFAIHSVEYTNLKEYFYAFNILNQNTQTYMSVGDMHEWSIAHNIDIAPVLYSGVIKSVKWLEKFLAEEMKKESELGGEREGFVIRVKDSFLAEDFSKSVFKYVRKGHIQNKLDDQGRPLHWSKHWKQAKLNKG